MKNHLKNSEVLEAIMSSENNQLEKSFETGNDKQLAQLTKEEKPTGLVKSRHTVTFMTPPQLPKTLKDRVVLKKVGKAKAEAVTFQIYYWPEEDKEFVLKTLKQLKGFKSIDIDRKFVLQTSNNEFVSAVPFTTSIYNRSLYWAAYFNVHDFSTPAYSGVNASYNNAAVAFEFENRLFSSSGEGILRFNPGSNRVEGNQLTPGYAVTSDNYFDPIGILGKPSWASDHMYTSFTMMTHAAQPPVPVDSREFVRLSATSGGSALQGSNHQIPWNAPNVFKYVEVIEDICIRAIHNNSHQGAQKDNMYLSVVNPNPNNQVVTQYVAQGTQNWPIGVFFDMFVFYGYWENRNTLSSKIVLRSKTGASPSQQPILVVNSDHSISLDNNPSDLRNSFLFVEQGWGQNNNKVLLRTMHGNHLKSWRTSVTADWGTFSGQEQWEILLP